MPAVSCSARSWVAPFAQWLAQQVPGSVIAMEACGSAHHWARPCLAHGLVSRLMAAQFVAPVRKSAAAKHDRNDAEAIATAARQGNMRFVAVKTIEQQARLSQHRIREGYKVEALAIGNRIRGLLAEFGIAVTKRELALRRALAGLPELDLPDGVRRAIAQLQQHLADVRRREAQCRQQIRDQARADARCQHILRLVGVGPLTADALVATLGNGCDFRNGRQLAAWLGVTLTKRECASNSSVTSH